MIEALDDWEGVTAYVEIKRASLRRFGREAVLQRIAQVVKPALDRCVLISFDLPSLQIMRQMIGARIGWVVANYDDKAMNDATSVAPDFLFANVDRLPAGLETLWPGRWDWALYEVRDLGTAQACQAMGARYVETMAVREMLDAYRESQRP